MKKLISVLVTLTMVMTLFTGMVFANPGNGNGNGNGKDKGFNDMSKHWSNESVSRIQSYGIIKGYADGTFKPDKAITEAELAVIIDRLTQLKDSLDEDQTVLDDEDTDADLTNVPDWAKDSVAKGIEKNYFNMKRFHSEKQCDRLTACVALAKALDLTPVTDFTSNPFKDRGLMSDADYGYVLALYKAGYINGYDGNFNPNALISRAQISKIIDEVLDDDGDTVTADTEKPTWSTGSVITASAIGSDSVVLSWTAAKDNVKVTAYKVSYYLNSVEKEKLVTATTAKITGLVADKKYTFTVEARDAAGYWSDNGPSVEVTTLDESDTSSPTWSTSDALTVSPSSATTVTLIWPDAEDNTAVQGYKVYQNNILIKTLNADAKNLVVSGLTENTEYTFKIRAFDEAGNYSSILSNIYLAN